jgi:RNA polymerase sigma factor (sigma-70 family)
MVVEVDILRRILHGEVDAFRYFIDTYKNMAFSIAMGMIQDESIAEDIVQTAFIKAFKNLKQFKKKSKFSTWFYTIVVNETRMQLRKNKCNIKSLDDDNFHEKELYEENPALLNLHKEDQKRMINNALSKLSPRENLLIRLYYQNENSIEEIQKITGFTVSNIKTGLHRARQNFNRVLTKEYKGEMIAQSSYGG